MSHLAKIFIGAIVLGALSACQLQRMTTDQSMIIAGLASLGFAATADGMAYMDE